MTFILLAALMIVLAAASIAIPLWRKPAVPDSVPAGETGLGVYDTQMGELAGDLESGVLAEPDYASARHDLETERRLHARPERIALRTGMSSRWLGLGLATLLVVCTGLLYWRVGDWRVGVEGIDAASRVAVINMVRDLATRLETKDQDDLQGWLMLGHAYVLMERYQDAVEALAHARKLAGDGNAEVLSAYAEALALADPDHFLQRAAPVFESVLKLAPDNQKALWYGGLAASQRGDNALAITRWQTLLQQGLPPKYSEILVNYIKAAGGSASPAASAPKATILHLRVTLDPSLKKKLDAGATVFVFARPEGGQGGPPLAVRRFTVRDLPLTTTLGDRDVMVAGRSLERFKALEVVARVSTDGSPIAKAGEPQGKAIWKRGSKQPLAIEIKPSRT